MNTVTNILDKAGIRIEGLQVILSIKDMNASRHFYKDILGFKEAEWGTDDFTSVNREMQAFTYAEGSRETLAPGFG